MIQGTASSVGKSFLVAGLCRVYARRGLRVAPFKAQNMSLNSAVTGGGAEISRSQAVQAEAAGIAAMVEMNPVLLKPESDQRSQLICMGKVVGTLASEDFGQWRPRLWEQVRSALECLRGQFDLVLIEGAGSPAEVNLRSTDMVNMRVAAEAQAPVLLASSIERGGVFAALLGTLDLLGPQDRGRIRGILINRFRGDPQLFADGVGFIERKASLPILGIIPDIQVRLPAEDSLELGHLRSPAGDMLDIAVILCDRISNFDELEPLSAEPGVGLRLVRGAGELGVPDLIIMPGSKMTATDLESLRRSGLADAIRAARSAGSAVIGICAGYQMLGRQICDPGALEQQGTFPGLGLLEVSTTFASPKVTRLRQGTVLSRTGLLAGVAGVKVSGYEIRMGRVGGDEVAAALDLGDCREGAVSADGWVVGTSVHGLFRCQSFRRGLLEALAVRKGVALPPAELGSDPFEVIADALEQSLNMEAIDQLAGLA